MILAEKIQNEISDSVFFDYVDPSSGLLMISNNQNHIYNEITGATSLLIGSNEGYEIKQVGMCMTLSHKENGIDIYPASMFFGKNIDKNAI